MVSKFDIAQVIMTIKAAKDKHGIGSRLLELRQRLGLTQIQMADSLGLTRSGLSQIETGVTAASVDLIFSAVSKFDINLDWLMFGRGGVDAQHGGHTENSSLISSLISSLNEESKINPTQIGYVSPPPPTRTEIIVATQDPTGNPTYTVVNHRAAANYLGGFQSQEYYESLGMVSLPRALTGSSKQGLFFQIEGDSMTPKFQHGDWVACTLLDRSEWSHVRDLDCYVVVSTTYGIQFKRVKSRLRDLGFLRCKSDNRRHRPYNIEEDNLLQLFRFVLHVSPDASNPEDALHQKVDHLEDTTTDLRLLFEQLQDRLDTISPPPKPPKRPKKPPQTPL